MNVQPGRRADNSWLRVSCRCGQRLKARPAQAGKSFRCPRCRHEVVIPHAAELPVEESMLLEADLVTDSSGTFSDLGALLDEALEEQARRKAAANEDTTCPWCGGKKAPEFRVCGYCAGGETSLRHDSVDRVQLHETSSGIVIDGCLLVSDEALHLMGGTVPRNIINHFDFRVQERYIDGDPGWWEHTVQIQCILRSGALVTLPYLNWTSDLSHMYEAQSKAAYVLGYLTSWQSGGLRVLRARFPVRSKQGNTFRLCTGQVHRPTY